MKYEIDCMDALRHESAALFHLLDDGDGQATVQLQVTGHSTCSSIEFLSSAFTHKLRRTENAADAQQQKQHCHREAAQPAPDAVQRN